MRFITYFCLIISIVSCSSKNTLCDCNEAGAKIDILNQDLILGERTKEKVDELKKLKSERDAICKEFLMISDDELEKAISECAELQIDTDLDQ